MPRTLGPSRTAFGHGFGLEPQDGAVLCHAVDGTETDRVASKAYVHHDPGKDRPIFDADRGPRSRSVRSEVSALRAVTPAPFERIGPSLDHRVDCVAEDLLEVALDCGEDSSDEGNGARIAQVFADASAHNPQGIGAEEMIGACLSTPG